MQSLYTYSRERTFASTINLILGLTLTFWQMIWTIMSCVFWASLSKPHTSELNGRFSWHCTVWAVERICRGGGEGGADQIQKVGLIIEIEWEGSGGTLPRNLESLHALKCVLGASEALFRASIQYTHICKLPSSFSDFRSKSTTYGAPSQWLRSYSHIHCKKV